MQQNYDLKYLKWEITRWLWQMLDDLLTCSAQKWGYKKLQMFRRSYLEIQHWQELWYLHLLILCPRHNTQLSLNVLLTHCVSRISLLLLFFSSPRLPQKSGVTSLILGLLSPLRMFISPSWIVPSWITVGEHHYLLHWWAGIHTPLKSHFRQSTLPQSPPGIMCGCGPTGSLTASAQLNSQSVGSEFTAVSFVVKHITYCLILGQAVKCWMLAVILVAGYWKCLTTMGSTLGAIFCHGYVSVLCTGPTKVKTLTLSSVMYILIYLLPLTHRQGNTRRHSLAIDTLTNGRKNV